MVSEEESVFNFVLNEDNTDYQTTRRNYCSKHDSSISTNKVVRGLSRRLSRKRGRRPQARRKSRDLLQGVKGGQDLLVVEVVQGRHPRDVVSLDLHSFVCYHSLCICSLSRFAFELAVSITGQPTHCECKAMSGI